MTVDMSQFYQTFFEESFEGLDSMESGLLNLDIGAADTETINTIFRAAHSIKGGAGTFGFKAVSDFTHIMETLLDEVRDGKRMVTQKSVDLLLRSVDCLRDMLTAVQSEQDIDQAVIAEVQAELEALLHNEQAENSASEAPDSEINAVEADAAEHEGWEIFFNPYDDLIKTGNDPVRMFRELSMLGDLDVELDSSQVPEFEQLDPEVCYLSWKLTLRSDVHIEQVEEVFEWVEGACDLSITPLLSATEAPQKTPQDDAVKEGDIEAATEESVPVPVVEAAESAKEQVVEKSSAPNQSPARKKPVSSGGEHGSIRVSTDKIDALINMVGELVITQSMLGQLGEDVDINNVEKLRDGLSQLERNTRELQESVMRIRMLPISFAFQRFPRMVRDLTNKLNKEIELKLSGEQTELDKTVMEKIGDPLVHLVRNSIDHGIESPDIREQAGKSRVGTVHLNAYHQGGNIVIEISDDGAGLNKEKIIDKAREKGIIAKDETPADDRIYEMIFDPGFSTADTVSDVSGRGVGMDVVKRNIRELGGSIEVTSKEGEGSTFTIRLPLTLAILDGQLVRVGGETFIIPLISIIESLQAKDSQVNAIAGQAELYKLRDDYIPIVRLYNTFGLQPNTVDLSKGLLVVVEGDGQKVGLFVDELLGQQQVVIKSLETNFRRVDGVSGATILGDGTVALILDIGSLIQISRDAPAAHTELAKQTASMQGQQGNDKEDQAA